jgi:chromate transporter
LGHWALTKRLAWVVFRDSNRTLGGGLASMELLRRSGAAEGWLDEGGHAVLTAVSRLTPGTNVLAYCACFGWLVSGWLGALVAVAAASVPGSLVIVALSAALVRVDRYPIVRFLIAAGVLAATGLVASSAWYLLKPYLNRSAAARTGIIAVVVGALLLLDVTPVRVLLVAAAIGALLGMPALPHAGATDQ